VPSLHVSPRLAPMDPQLCTYVRWFARPTKAQRSRLFYLSHDVSKVRLFSSFVLVFVASPLTWGAGSGFHVLSVCVICVVPLWVMNTTLFFTAPLLPRCGTVTPSSLNKFASPSRSLRQFIWQADLRAVVSFISDAFQARADLRTSRRRHVCGCPPIPPPPSLPYSFAPFHWCSSSGPLCGPFFLVSTSACVVDILSCPRGWTDVTSSSLQEWREKDQPNVQGREPQGFKL
jgi:hypothetical protein